MSKKRRQRLTYEQQIILEQEFQIKSDWSHRGYLNELAKRLELSRSKIYKWNWDRKKKELQMQASDSMPSAMVDAAASNGASKPTFRVTQERSPLHSNELRSSPEDLDEDEDDSGE